MKAERVEYKIYFKNLSSDKTQYCKAAAKMKKRKNKDECSKATFISTAKKLENIKYIHKKKYYFYPFYFYPIPIFFNYRI
tara:strand:+ start:217 stop:456 length:240 start_codon:yes stop_codon:yes gene_type:complete